MISKQENFKIDHSKLLFFYEACSIHSAEARDQLNSLKTTKQHFENAKVYASRGYHDRALKSLDRIKEITPWFAEMRELRANSFEMFGETLGWNDRDLGNFLRYYLNVIVETVRAVQPETEENKMYTHI